MATQLFGPTPIELQQAQQAALQDKATQYAQLNPLQRAAQGMYQAGSNIGGGIAGLMGIQDPAMERRSAITAIASNYDYNSPEGLIGLAKELADKGFQQESMLAAAKAQEISKASAENKFKLSEVALKTAQTGAVPGEIALRAAQATKAGFDQLSEEQAQTAARASLKEDGNLSEAQIEGIVKNPKARESYLSYIADKTQIVEANGRQLLINKETGKLIKDVGAAPERGTRVNVNVDAKGEAEFVKNLAKIDAAEVGDARKARAEAVKTISSLNQLASLPADQLITGQFATGRVGVTSLLTTLGLASPTDVTKLVASQQYQKTAGDVILQTLGGKLGSGFSNADREFITSLVPQLETNPEARRRLITFMQEKNQDIVKETIRLENYARQNKGLSGFESKIPMSVTPNKSNPYADLSDEELGARIKAAQAKK